jgi:hypothetical protein
VAQNKGVIGKMSKCQYHESKFTIWRFPTPWLNVILHLPFKEWHKPLLAVFWCILVIAMYQYVTMDEKLIWQGISSN